jgi:lysozyme
MDADKLLAELVTEEALKLKPYTDTVGKLTIGVGRNLSDRGISRDEAVLFCRNDIAATCADLDRALPWWRDLEEPRQRVLADMGFNLGVPHLLGFQRMLAAARAGDFLAAAQEMMSSKWASQVGARAVHLAATMRDGVDP